MELDEIRKEIDKNDSNMLQLFEKRMRLAGEVGNYKKQNSLPIYDANREKQLMENRLSMLENADFEPYAKQMFKTLMELSKGYQFQILCDKNIVLIGIMGCGKSCKGKLLANRLGMKYVDVDSEIENDYNMTISQIFEKYGKVKFREIESQKISDLSKERKYVISTGGGVVLSDTNMERLKENGIVVFLNRDIDEIVKTIDITTRPLLEDGAQKLYEIYNDRLSLYKKWCDIEMTGNKSVEESVDDIIDSLF